MSEPPSYPPSGNSSEPGDPNGGRPSPSGRPGPGQPQPTYQPPPATQPQYGQPQYGQPQYGEQYGQPQYGQPQYGEQYGQGAYPQPAGSPPGSAPAGSGLRLAERIGPRLLRRPEPRFGVTLAAIGVALTLFGIAVVGNQSGDDGEVSGGRKTIGIVLALALVAAGYGILWARRNGPLSTTGVAATALGVPLLLSFISSAADLGTSAGVNLVVIVSLIVWLGSYLFVPGAQGHVFYLGAFAVTFWFYLLSKIEPQLLKGLVLLPFAGLRVSSSLGDSEGGESPFGFTALPDFTTVATISILFGVVYYIAAYALDRTGRSGPAVAFAVAGLPAMVLGLAVAAINAPQSVEGILIVVVGALLGLLGARTGRRFTTWFWTAAVGLGIVVIVADVVEDQNTTAGVVLIVTGALVVVLAQLLTTALREPDETVPTPPRIGAPPVS